MSSEPSLLLETLELAYPLIGVYDAPDPKAFTPLVSPARKHHCLFASWNQWREGITLHLTSDKS